MMRVAGLSEVAPGGELLFPAARVTMPNVCVYSNARLRGGAGGIVYKPRLGEPDAIRLHALPAGAVLHCAARYTVAVGELLIAEQTPPQFHADPAGLLARNKDLPPLEVRGDMLLCTRYGERTWGHWVGEMLPKLVLAERLFPGRFTYVLPMTGFSTVFSGNFITRARESLAAYGVTEARCLLVREGRSYRFGSLFYMSPVWSDAMPHPAARAALRDIAVPVAAALPAPPGARVALLRGDNTRRQIDNREAVLACLERRGFAVFDIGLLPFTAQIAVMRAARTVFSILGSSLTGLIYAEDGVGVVSAAPEGFTDRFFYALMQMGGARYGEVFGPVVEEDPRYRRDSSFCVPVAALEAALDAVG